MVLFFSILQCSYAIETIDAGFEDRFEFSNTTIEKNVKIKAYTYFNNNSGFDLKATALFYIDNKEIESKTFFVQKDTRITIWTTIRISEPSTLKVKLTSLQKDTNNVLEGVYSNNNETKTTLTPGQALPELNNVKSTIVGTSKNIIDSAEQTRLNINSSLKNSIDEIEIEAEKSNGLTFKKIWLWILKIFHIVSDNFILSIVAFIIFMIYLYRYSKAGYHKIKK